MVIVAALYTFDGRIHMVACLGLGCQQGVTAQEQEVLAYVVSLFCAALAACFAHCLLFSVLLPTHILSSSRSVVVPCASWLCAP